MTQQAKDNSTGHECIEVNCKAKPKKLSFCLDHYAQFKFGSVKKNGTHPVDKEKKDAQYERHKKAYESV